MFMHEININAIFPLFFPLFFFLLEVFQVITLKHLPVMPFSYSTFFDVVVVVFGNHVKN